MNALGYFFESEGVATTGISLVREHTEAMRPPRFLWVPFELGRPLGAPNVPDFQRRVILAALALLEAERGPVLVDFPEDAPRAPVDTEAGWVGPSALPPEASVATHELEGRALQELEQLAPLYALARTKRGRTTVGLSGLTPPDMVRFLAAFLNKNPVDGEVGGPLRHLPLGEAFKLVSEDLKAYCLEAASVRSDGEPNGQSAQRLAIWFWQDTVMGRLFRALHTTCLDHPDPGVQAIAKGAFVPRSQQM